MSTLIALWWNYMLERLPIKQWDRSPTQGLNSLMFEWIGSDNGYVTACRKEQVNMLHSKSFFCNLWIYQS